MKPWNALAALLVIGGCTVPLGDSLQGRPTSTSDPDAGDAQLQCADIPQAVLAPKCGGAAGCHAPPSPAAKLDLLSANVADRLVGVKDSKGAFLLIDPVDPEESLIYERVLGAATPRMPPDVPLDEGTTACLLSWIRSVAPHPAGATPDSGAPAPTTEAGSASDATDRGADGPAGTVVRVACGASAPYTDHDGNVWAADSHFSGGQPDTHNPAVSIANTKDAPLYNSQRYGDGGGRPVSFSYAFDVPNGSYHVTLKFAETYLTGAGQRLFDVSINDQKKLTAFDIFKTAGGADVAADQAFDVDVTGGALKIQFDPGAADFPKVDAIEILSK
jgi:hypothetical protein